MLSDYNSWQMVFGITILSSAYFVRGVTGFGSALIAIPMLSVVLPIHIVIPLVVILDYLGSAGQGIKNRSAVQWYFVLPLIPFTLIGVITGLILFHQLSSPALYQSLGTFIILFALFLMTTTEVNRHRSFMWVIPAGVFGGMAGTLFGMGGPFYAAYMRLQGMHPYVFRANFAMIFIMDGTFRLTGYFGTGLVTSDLLELLIVSVPIMLVSVFIGGLMHQRLRNWNIKRDIRILSMAGGVALIVKSFYMP